LVVIMARFFLCRGLLKVARDRCPSSTKHFLHNSVPAFSPWTTPTMIDPLADRMVSSDADDVADNGDDDGCCCCLGFLN
jgi:hypothetical protein